MKSISRLIRPTLILTLLFMGSTVTTANAFTGSMESRLAAKPNLMDAFEPSNESSVEFIGHNRWQSLLDVYLIEDREGANLFRYSAVTERDRGVLNDYIASLEAIGITNYTRAEQQAYWINIYNALTVRVVLDNYPTRSIREINISPGLFSSGPWGKKLVTIEGVELSLDDIEHRILRPIWQDNRVHYAVNCASMGCPDLWPQAFTPENMEDVMEAAAANFINSDRGVFIEGGRMRVSKIYEWYDEDFGGSDDGVIEHLLKYARKPLARDINRRLGAVRTDYDWDLNEPQ